MLTLLWGRGTGNEDAPGPDWVVPPPSSLVFCAWCFHTAPGPYLLQLRPRAPSCVPECPRAGAAAATCCRTHTITTCCVPPPPRVVLVCGPVSSGDDPRGKKNLKMLRVRDQRQKKKYTTYVFLDATYIKNSLRGLQPKKKVHASHIQKKEIHTTYLPYILPSFCVRPGLLNGMYGVIPSSTAPACCSVAVSDPHACCSIAASNHQQMATRKSIQCIKKKVHAPHAKKQK